MAFQRNNHVLFVDGISVQHFILRDQAVRAFGEEDLVAELDRHLHLAALDEVSMGLENRIDLLGSWNLFAMEHTAARLIDHTGSQVTKVLDLLARLRDHSVGEHVFAMRLRIPQRHSCVFQNLLGNADELAVFLGLLLLTLPRGHPLDLLHSTPRRSRPIPEPLDTPTPQRCGEAANQARDDANDIPQQRVVGRMMNVGLHHRGVDTQLLAVLQFEVDRRLHVSRVKPRWNASCRGTGRQ